MKAWTKLLPFFFVERYARQNCEILVDQTGHRYVAPFLGVRIYLPPKEMKE